MTLLHGRRGAAALRPDDARPSCPTSSTCRCACRSASSASSRRGTSRSRSRPGRSCPALVCGNTVVFKPANDTPLLGRALRRAPRPRRACPTGVVNVVHGFGARRRRPHRPPPGRAASSRFTGSRETGVKCSRRPPSGSSTSTSSWAARTRSSSWTTPTSTSPPTGILWSAFGTSGQRCTAASRVIVHEQVYDELQGAARRARRGDAARPRLGGRHRRRPGHQPARARQDPLVHRDRQGRGREAPHRRRGRVRQRALATASTTGRRSSATSMPGMRIAQEEIFGPTTALIRVESFEEAIEVANGVKLRALVVDLHRAT